MKSKFLMQLCLVAACAAVLSPACAQTQRYTLADDGNAVLDAKTGLIWKRCEEGKTFRDGGCRGLGIRYDWSQIETMKTPGWRLPTAEELKTLKEDTGVAPPINREFFPNTDRSWFWSSSAGERDASGCIQNVYFGNDIVRRCPAIRANSAQLALKPAYVRLVRNN
jgi:hypothetical protein